MILSRKAQASSRSILSLAICMLLLSSFIYPLRAQQPDAVPPSASDQAPPSDAAGRRSSEAIHLIGLPDIKEKEKGSLSISRDAVTFVSPEGKAELARAQITNVSVGGVLVETGGSAGKVIRAIIPFGGGSALATVTHKQLSLLTIEYRDHSDAIHGAVFLLPKDEAVQAELQVGTLTSPVPLAQLQTHCETNGGGSPGSIKIAAITTSGDPIPAEYRVLLYEQLAKRLQDQGTFTAVYRDGDDRETAACPEYNLLLTLEAFKKGNAAVRASTGPLGFFVGATSLKFHVQVQSLNGKMLIDKELHASQRGDSDSLDIGSKIAKTLTKDLKKSKMRTART